MDARTRLVYPSDLTDAEWQWMKDLIPGETGGGRHRDTDMRQVVNGILYLLRSGCSWRMLPKDFPPYTTVHEYYRRWRKDGTAIRIHDALRRQVRTEAGRDPEPSAGVIDSQSTKTTEVGGEHGYDAGKKINGRKRHLLVDTMGLVLMVVVHTANIQDRDGARLLLAKAKGLFPRLQRIWADGGYAGKLIGWLQETCGWVLEIIKRSDAVKGFKRELVRSALAIHNDNKLKAAKELGISRCYLHRLLNQLNLVEDREAEGELQGVDGAGEPEEDEARPSIGRAAPMRAAARIA